MGALDTIMTELGFFILLIFGLCLLIIFLIRCCNIIIFDTLRKIDQDKEKKKTNKEIIINENNDITIIIGPNNKSVQIDKKIKY